MINSDLSYVVSLEDFHSEIRRQQEEAHGADYCAIHDAITKYMADCKSYMELGTHQGGTASAAMLCKPEKVYLVDMDMSRYRKFLEPIAADWCDQNDIALTVRESDSRSIGTLNITDMLVIDSYHHPNVMQAELELHGRNTLKYIIAHDTSIVNGKPNDSLYRCMENWGKKNGFEVIERGTTNVGYTVMKRK